MKIYAISDMHGKLNFSVPPCDLLLIAGDLAPDFAPGTEWGSDMQLQWLKSKFANWLAAQPAKLTALTWGNHDFVHGGMDFGDLTPHIVIDQQVCFGALNDLKIWFSPWCNPIGNWAWMSFPDHLGKIYSRIPQDTDIIVSHQPPFGYGDQVPDYMIRIGEDPNGHVGSTELLNTITRVRPKAVVCGHIHNGHGAYPINLDDGTGMDPNEHHLTVYNVSMVNESYQRVYEPTEIIL